MRNIKEVTKSVDLTKNVYRDGAKEFFVESGKTISLLPKTINAALLPLRKWIINREYIYKETEILLQKKLRNIEIEKIVEPESYIAVPALQAISYSMDNETIRNLYANLLANSMNRDMKDSVHPSFVTIISQMSPIDAIIFKIIYESKTRPLITLYFELDNNKGQDHHLYNLSWINSYDYIIVSVSIDNLIRMGLIKIPTDKHYINDSNYNSVRENDKYCEYYKKYSNISGGKVKEERQVITITDFGELFYIVCVKDV